jgi:hypothetical protein
VTPEELAELERLEKAAPVGHWTATYPLYKCECEGPSTVVMHDGSKIRLPIAWTYNSEENARATFEFIIAARNALPDLIRMAQRLALAERLNQQLTELARQTPTE